MHMSMPEIGNKANAMKMKLEDKYNQGKETSGITIVREGILRYKNT